MTGWSRGGVLPRTAAALAAAGLTLALLPGQAGAEPEPSTAGKGGQAYYVPVSGSLTVVGNGYGHGRGLSQYGAEGAARQGKGHREILRFYYPGTRVGKHSGPVRVLISADTTSDVVVRPVTGLRVRDLGAAATLTVPEYQQAREWRLVPQTKRARRTVVQYRTAQGWKRWRTLVGDGQFTADSPLTLVLPDGSTRRYRGVLRAASPYAGAGVRDTVNVVSMDDYVRGVIAAEMPASWHQQALRAQAVAARTYAAHQQRASRERYWQICDTTACQVYTGVGAETTGTDRAVRGTARLILLDGSGKPAFTQFSASSGGWTADGDQPYLRARQDGWDRWDGNPHHGWRQQISVASLESAYPQLGSLERIRTTRRDGHGAWGGRVVQAVLEGTRGSVSVTGDDLRWRYGLRSSWFAFEPTPILAAWKSLGGATSRFGAIASTEAGVRASTGTQGARQLFERGRIFWTPRGGASPLAGPLLARYRKLGGPQGRYGLPVGAPARTATDDGTRLALEKGRLYVSQRTGVHALYGRIMLAHQKRRAVAGPLGYPVTDVEVDGDRQSARFEGGRIVLNGRKLTVTLRD